MPLGHCLIVCPALLIRNLSKTPNHLVHINLSSPCHPLSDLLWYLAYSARFTYVSAFHSFYSVFVGSTTKGAIKFYSCQSINSIISKSSRGFHLQIAERLLTDFTVFCFEFTVFYRNYVPKSALGLLTFISSH